MKLLGWTLVIGSSLLNVGWLVSVRHTHGFQRWQPMVTMVVFGALSTYCLSRSLLLVPAAEAYTVYSGLTVAGSLVFDLWVLHETIGAPQLACLALILAGTIGLQALSLRV